MQTRKVLSAVLAKLTGVGQSQKKFISEMIIVILSLRGRATFKNMSRFSSYHECSMRRHYEKDFDFVNFNQALINACSSGTQIGVMDCSFSSKAGKHTYGKDYFWNGSEQRVKKGLEISLVGVVEVASKQSYCLDVVQTPAGLAAKEQAGYTRLDFYLEQLSDVIPTCPQLHYWVGDGYYAKEKVFDLFQQQGRYFITKLRSDANLQYLAEGKQRNGTRGAFRKYAGKVDFQDLHQWEQHWGHCWSEELTIYSKVLYHVHLKRKLKVVLLLDQKKKTYVLLASTHLSQEASQIVHYYRLPFQIEFIFRDAKQFCGLTHGQARSGDKLDFHFNLSCAALNVARAEMKLYQTATSMNSYVRMAYNQRFARLILNNLDLMPDFDISQHPAWNALINLGSLAA